MSYYSIGNLSPEVSARNRGVSVSVHNLRNSPARPRSQSFGGRKPRPELENMFASEKERGFYSDAISKVTSCIRDLQVQDSPVNSPRPARLPSLQGRTRFSKLTH